MLGRWLDDMRRLLCPCWSLREEEAKEVSVAELLHGDGDGEEDRREVRRASDAWLHAPDDDAAARAQEEEVDEVRVEEAPVATAAANRHEAFLQGQRRGLLSTANLPQASPRGASAAVAAEALYQEQIADMQLYHKAVNRVLAPPPAASSEVFSPLEEANLSKDFRNVVSAQDPVTALTQKDVWHNPKQALPQLEQGYTNDAATTLHMA